MGGKAKTTFEIVAANTAVLETIAMPEMEEMVTLYSVDGDSITLVHYCPTEQSAPDASNPRVERRQAAYV